MRSTSGSRRRNWSGVRNECAVAAYGADRKCGLEKVAHFREVGFKFDRWIDVGYWQRTL
jgi:L-amino acid N-acyltransferase YncA